MKLVFCPINRLYAKGSVKEDCNLLIYKIDKKSKTFNYGELFICVNLRIARSIMLCLNPINSQIFYPADE